MTPVSVRKISQRDPAGRLYAVDGRLLRLVEPGESDFTESVVTSPRFSDWMVQGKVVGTRIVSAETKSLLPQTAGLGLEHDVVFFPSYAYEWTPEMLFQAATLTLQMAKEALESGWNLKDATPYNVLFEGSRAVFVDVLSFEKRREGEASWLPFGQFARTFLYPLLLSRDFGIPLDMLLLTHRDGLDAGVVYRLLSWAKRLRQPYFSLVSVPYWLGLGVKAAAAQRASSRARSNEEKARFIVGALLKHLEKTLNSLAPRSIHGSRWKGYVEKSLPYTSEQYAEKKTKVRSIIESLRPRSVLDVGCNTGDFSLIAAETGAAVVSIDSDPSSVREVFVRAQSQQKNILPLHVNIVIPPPPTGWRNQEGQSFLERAHNKFDMTMWLAVIHHLILGEQIGMEEVFELVAHVTKRHALVEFIGEKDPMVQSLAASRRSWNGYSRATFEQSLKKHFVVEQAITWGNSERSLYLLGKVS